MPAGDLALRSPGSVVPSALSLVFRRWGEWVVVEVTGEVDVATAPALAAALDDVILGQGCLSIAVDLAGTTFLDARGLHLLAKASRRLRARHGRFLIVRAPRATARIVDISGLGDVLEMVPELPPRRSDRWQTAGAASRGGVSTA
jgi:anti-sigma B factor antagonist